nr:hypothetical protein B0A51_06745 [Rachicladosporium sp. CCFEE 5018]
MATQKPFEIAIVGGGITGLTLAIALHHRGIKIQIYEAAKAFGEIGAGVSFNANAVGSMKICHDEVYDAFLKVRTRNLWPSKEKVWFDYHDAFGDEGDELETSKLVYVSSRLKYSSPFEQPADDGLQTIYSSIGQNGVHRARYLECLIHLVPDELCHFNKRLKNIVQTDAGRSTLHFADGSTAEADAIIGCDGIKSNVRRLLHGDDHPCAQPTFTHKIAYRGVVPMEQAIKAVGEERASNACMYLGPGGHMLTFPVNHGQTLNIVAFTTKDEDWTTLTGQSSDKLTAPTKREKAIKDFAGFSGDVQRLLRLTAEDLDIWAIFHLGDNPPPSYAKGNIAILGDAAHATSPHHGAGAGMCIEDSAVMAELLADTAVQTREDVEVVFATFSELRKERGDGLVQSSARQGRIYEWQTEYGRDFGMQEEEIKKRNARTGEVNVGKLVEDAREVLRKRLADRS